MTHTIWSNAGRYEWIVREGEAIVARSGLIYRSHAAAKRAMRKANAVPPKSLVQVQYERLVEAGIVPFKIG
jgi:hypothetical protein